MDQAKAMESNQTCEITVNVSSKPSKSAVEQAWWVCLCYEGKVGAPFAQPTHRSTVLAVYQSSNVSKSCFRPFFVRHWNRKAGLSVQWSGKSQVSTTKVPSCFVVAVTKATTSMYSTQVSWYTGNRLTLVMLPSSLVPRCYNNIGGKEKAPGTHCMTLCMHALNCRDIPRR